MKHLLAIVALCAALGACGRNGYDATYERNFMQSCQLEGASEALCGCVWARVEAEIPRADLDGMELAIQAGEQDHPVKQRLLALTQQCRAAGSAE